MLCRGLSSNALSGPIPGTWGTSGGFQNLYSLYLMYNKLSGFVPGSLTLLPRLRQLCAYPLSSTGMLCQQPLFIWRAPSWRLLWYGSSLASRLHTLHSLLTSLSLAVYPTNSAGSFAAVPALTKKVWTRPVSA